MDARNGERPYDVIGQAKRIVLGYIAKHNPHLVAIEELLAIAMSRGAVLQVILHCAGEGAGNSGRGD